MRFLHDNYTTAIIPFAQLSSPRQGFSIPKVLSYTQLEQLFACLDNKERLPKDIRDTMVLLLLFVTGMRVSELVSLNLDAIDWHERIIRVFGKGAKERLIPVPQEFVDKLYYYVTSVRPVLLKYMSHNNCQSLFNLSRQGIWYILKSRGKKVGITLYPHLLRHSFATHFLANGADLRSLQTLLGHRNLTTTQIYTHVDKHQLRQVYNNAHLRK
jgi:integrase/recombinase XerD